MLLLCLIAGLAWRTGRNIKLMAEDTGSYTDMGYNLWLYGDEIRAYLMDKDPTMKLVDTCDGMFAYYLDMPSESQRGLPSSPMALTMRAELGMWKSLITRGYNLVPSFSYFELERDRRVVRVLETYLPPHVPIAFYKVALTHPAMREDDIPPLKARQKR